MLYVDEKKRVKKRGFDLWTCSRILQPWYGLDWLVRLIIENLGGPLYIYIFIYSLSMWRKYHGQVARCVWPIKQTKPPPPPKKKKKAKNKKKKDAKITNGREWHTSRNFDFLPWICLLCIDHRFVLSLSLFSTMQYH